MQEGRIHTDGNDASVLISWNGISIVQQNTDAKINENETSVVCFSLKGKTFLISRTFRFVLFVLEKPDYIIVLQLKTVLMICMTDKC